MSKTLAATILGVFILLSAVVIASPESTNAIADLILTVLKWTCIAVVAIIATVVGLILLAVWAEGRY
jgi:hypothetical protein